jgi:uncharacterized protein (DUF2267 family)
MNELVKMVSEQAGISEKQARDAVNTVLKFARQKLPRPIASQLEAAIRGGKADDLLGGLAKGLEGLKGKDD